MKSRYCLPLLVLLGAAAGVSAQPYGYGHPPIPPGYGPGPMPYGGAVQPALPVAPGRPAAPPARMAVPPAATPPTTQAEAPAALPQGPAAEASATLKQGMDRLLGYLAQKEAPDRLQVAAFINREIAPYFDFDHMAQWVAGPAYQRMNAEDRKAMAARLEADFLGTLASQLMNYQGQQIRLLPPRMGPRGAVNINVALVRPGTYPSRLEFRMYKADTSWRVYDVVADGQSASAFYRVQFQRLAGEGAAPAR